MNNESDLLEPGKDLQEMTIQLLQDSNNSVINNDLRKKRLPEISATPTILTTRHLPLTYKNQFSTNGSQLTNNINNSNINISLNGSLLSNDDVFNCVLQNRLF